MPPKRKRQPVRRGSTSTAGIQKTIKRRRGSDPLLSGTTAVGNKTIRFRASTVKSIDLTDRRGKVIGISFPTKPDDKTDVRDWARQATRTSDTGYLPDYASDDEDDPTKLQPTPWTGQQPFYVHAHARPETFSVTVKTSSRSGPVKQKVRIDGPTHGQLLKSNTHFQQACGARSPRPVVYMSCRSADPSGTAASGSARFLHDSGSTATVYAPTGTGVRIVVPGDKTSYYGVKPQPSGGTGVFQPFPPS